MNIGDRVIVNWAGRTEIGEVIAFDRGETVVRIGDGRLYESFRDSEIAPLEPDCIAPDGLEVA